MYKLQILFSNPSVQQMVANALAVIGVLVIAL